MESNQKFVITPYRAHYHIWKQTQTCAQLGRYILLVIEFEGVQLSFRCATLKLVSLRANDYTESSSEIEQDLGRFRRLTCADMC